MQVVEDFQPFDSDHDYEVNEDEFEESEEEGGSSSLNFEKLPLATATGSRYGMSRNQMMNFTNSLFLDLDLPDYFISASKFDLMKKELGKVLTKSHMEQNHGFGCLGFDGTKGDVRVDRVKTEHSDKTTVICQVDRKYVDHFTHKEGDAETIFKGFLAVRAQT